jgi:hypothetical protein
MLGFFVYKNTTSGVGDVLKMEYKVMIDSIAGLSALILAFSSGTGCPKGVAVE